MNQVFTLLVMTSSLRFLVSLILVTIYLALVIQAQQFIFHDLDSVPVPITIITLIPAKLRNLVGRKAT